MILNKTCDNPVTILCIHRVLKCSGPDEAIDEMYLRKGYSYLSEDDFRRKLEFLKQQFVFISLECFVQALNKNQKFPPNCIVLTFDDGYIDNYVNIYPIIKAMEIPVTFFLITDYISNGELKWDDKITVMFAKSIVEQVHFRSDEIDWDYKLKDVLNKADAVNDICSRIKYFNEKQREKFIHRLAVNLKVPDKTNDMLKSPIMMSWAQVKELAQDSLVSFGAHTCTHPVLSRIPEERAKDEIYSSKAVIEENISRSVNVFSYPYGGCNDFNDRLKKIVIEGGFSAACTTVPGKNNAKTDRYELRRVDFMAEPFSLFKVRMMGVLDFRPIIGRR